MDNNVENYELYNASLPDGWFISDEEFEERMVDDKGWVYSKHRKKNSVPCLIFPI